MNLPDIGRFTAAMQSLCAVFRQQPDESLLDAYWASLRPFPIDAVKKAMRRAVDECEFMPRPVELRRMLGHLSPQMRAVRSWGVVSDAIESVGRYQSVDFEDALAGASVRLTGGWPRLCRMTEHELGFARADYVRVYVSLAMAPATVPARKHLPGMAELENLANGHPVQKPVWVASDPHQRLRLGANLATQRPSQQLEAPHE